MTGLISAISGQFGKPLILGTFFPSVVFILLCWIFVTPLVTYPLGVLQPLQQIDTLWQVFAATFVTILVSGLLYNLNTPIIRFYEGYPWKDLMIGTWRTKYYARVWRTDSSLYHGLLALLRGGAPDPDGLLYEALTNHARRLNDELPDSGSRVLPTRLGNVIRSFEDYPYSQYRMDSVLLWPRLLSVIAKDFAAAVDDAKSSFDFMLNGSVLSLMFAILLFIAGVVFGAPFRSPSNLVGWLVELLVAAEFSYLMYEWSIGRAHEWGEFVKSAFDLYRWDLLKALGYSRIPASHQEELEFWRALSNKLSVGEWPPGGEQPYAASTPTVAPTVATGLPPGVQLLVLRGVAPSTLSDSAIQVVIDVRNEDPVQAAHDVVVTDTLPEGFDYVWGSAQASSPQLRVEGANPVVFKFDALERGHHARLTYMIKPRPKQPGAAT